MNGSITYLGKKFRVKGERRGMRAAITLIDPSLTQRSGAGYVVWSPTPDRTSQILNRDSTETDQIKVFFRLSDGSTAAGIHKTLKRLSTP